MVDQVEKVARAISKAAYDNMRAQGFSGGWDHDELGRAIARAAITAYNPNERLREALEVADHLLNVDRFEIGSTEAAEKAAHVIRAALSHKE